MFHHHQTDRIGAGIRGGGGKNSFFPFSQNINRLSSPKMKKKI